MGFLSPVEHSQNRCRNLFGAEVRGEFSPINKSKLRANFLEKILKKNRVLGTKQNGQTVVHQEDKNREKKNSRIGRVSKVVFVDRTNPPV